MESSISNDKDSEILRVKIIYKTALVLYLFILLWLVLFKFSFNITAVLSDYKLRHLNLIPFAGSSLRDVLYNFVVFIPFGLLLSVNLRRTIVWRKLALILAFSLAIETTQFVLAIGRADVTDVITNTFGGLIGLVLYEIASKQVDSEKLDRIIAVTALVLFVIFLLLRIFFFRFRYNSAH